MRASSRERIMRSAFITRTRPLRRHGADLFYLPNGIFRSAVVWHFPVAIPPSLGVWAVFMSVLVTQLGMPIPAAPMLIFGGTMAAMGQASYASVVFSAVAATLLADSLWFFTGRAYGRRLLNYLVRFSLSLDTTVRLARNTYERHGAPILTIAKFLPGLGLISAPLLGTTAISVSVFLLWDLIGATLWASVWVIGGAALHDQIVQLVLLVRQNGGTIVDAFAAIFIAAMLYRWVRRLQFRRWLAHTRITPDQLDALMKSDDPPLILDARPHSVREKESHRIAGARPLDLDSPDPIHPELLKRPIVVYCVCPNEATAKRIVSQLHRKNIHHIRALKGGLDAWEKRGYPVEPLPPDFNTAMAHMIEDKGHEGEYTVRARVTE
jgi:membrane protein DedA with SNARE-associated domain/rhodanese-related sulfurtransferase